MKRFGILALILVVVVLLAAMVTNVSAANPLTASNILVATCYDEHLLKLDLDGNIIWNIDIGAITAGAPTMDVTTNPNDGSVYVISLKANTTGYLTKLDSNGNILWNKDISFMCQPGAGGPTNMDLDPNDGSVYIIASGGYNDPFGLYKFDSNGNLLWKISANQNSHYGFQSVAVNPTDGSVYLSGYVEGVNKFDKNGHLIWYTDIPSFHNSYGFFSIAVNPADGSAVAISRFTGVVVKLDTNGHILWNKSTSKDNTAVAVDPNTNAVYVIGSGYLHKLDLKNGNLIWEHFISSNLMGVVVNYNDGSVYVGNNPDKTLHKVDPNNGSILWTKEIGYPTWGISISSTLTSAAFNPTSGPVGTVITVTGAGWAASETITGVTVGGIAATHTLTVNGSGAISGTLTIPAISAGDKDIVITGFASGAHTFTNAFTVLPPTDTTPPVVTATLSPIPNPVGWNNTDVVITWSASDPESGIVSGPTPASQTVSSEGTGQVFTATATNGAGLVGTGSVTLNIDKTLPVVTVTLPNDGVYILNQIVNAAWSATDTGGSGVVPPDTGTLPINTSSVGMGKTLTAPAGIAVDVAGNQSVAVTVTYSVQYAFGGFLPPLGPGPRSFKAGSTIPVKFQLTDAGGIPVSTASGTASVAGVSANIRYDATAMQYIANLKTPKDAVAGSYTITVSLNDGTTHSIGVTLK